MKRSLLSLLALLAIGLSAQAQIRFAPNPQLPLPENIHFYMNPDNAYEGRFGHMRPTWFIYPDGPCNREQAEALVQEMGLNDTLKDFVGMVAVLGPSDGVSYDREKDFALYETLFNKIRVFTNLKVVGIGSGATFVNEAIAPIASEVADIVSIGGKASKKVEGTSTVPAYLAGKEAAKAAKAYIARDKAALVEDGKTLKIYKNAEEPLLQVIVNTDKNPSLKATLADAWERLLSVNYRCSNLGHTSYMGALLGQYGDYELEPYLMWERLGMQRILRDKQLLASRQVLTRYLWYEYVPDSLADAPEKSVPLVILLHGHNNDPRTQAETSGFVELGAQEGFLVAELEWQGKDPYNYMGAEGIELTVREILKTYPQLDPSRVYVEGLSAGGFAATALGICKSHVFAAVGAHSGGLFYGEMQLGFPFQDGESLKAQVKQLRGKVFTPYICVTGTADDAVPYYAPESPNGKLLQNAWKLYLEYAGFEVPEKTDMQRYPVFGLPLEHRERIETVKHHAMEVGERCKDGHPLIRLVAVENFGHWNFVPGARQMWDFFKHWRRDPVTLESVYCNQ